MRCIWHNSCDETRAILHIGTARNLAVEGSRHRPISFRAASNFGWAGPKDSEQAFERMNRQELGGSGPLDYIRRTAVDAVSASKQIRRAVNDYRTPVKWPTGPGGPTPAATDLRTVAALINADFPARVYYVSQGGFDTHFGQTGPGHRRGVQTDFAASLSRLCSPQRATPLRTFVAEFARIWTPSS